MHPRQIEQIPLYKSPSLSFSAHLFAWRRGRIFSFFCSSSSFVLFFFPFTWLYSCSPPSFVLSPQRFKRSPIVSSTFEIVRAPPGLYSSLISTLNPSFFPSALAAAAAVENGGWWRRRRQGSSVYLLPFHSGVERTNIGSPLGVGSPPKLDRKEKIIFFFKSSEWNSARSRSGKTGSWKISEENGEM